MANRRGQGQGTERRERSKQMLDRLPLGPASMWATWRMCLLAYMLEKGQGRPQYSIRPAEARLVLQFLLGAKVSDNSVYGSDAILRGLLKAEAIEKHLIWSEEEGASDGRPMTAYRLGANAMQTLRIKGVKTQQNLESGMVFLKNLKKQLAHVEAPDIVVNTDTCLSWLLLSILEEGQQNTSLLFAAVRHLSAHNWPSDSMLYRALADLKADDWGAVRVDEQLQIVSITDVGRNWMATNQGALIGPVTQAITFAEKASTYLGQRIPVQAEEARE